MPSARIGMRAERLGRARLNRLVTDDPTTHLTVVLPQRLRERLELASISTSSRVNELVATALSEYLEKLDSQSARADSDLDTLIREARSVLSKKK